MLAQHTGKDRNKKHMCLILLIETGNDQIVTSLHWFSNPKYSASWPLWHASNRTMYEVQIKKPKTGCRCGKPFSTVLSHMFADPSFFHQEKEANKFVLTNPHLPWLLCAVDQQRGTLLKDRSYTVECFSKEFNYIKVVRWGCTLRRGRRKTGGKGGIGWFCLGVEFFCLTVLFLPISFPKWQFNTFCLT